LAEKNKGAVSTLDLVLFALLTCDGDQRFVATDEVAIQAFRLFPLKFCWDTFAHLPSWDRVRQWLSEAKKEKHGTLVEGFSGDRKEGWKLTPAGIRRLRFKQPSLDGLEAAAADERRYIHLPTTDLVAYAVEELTGSTRLAQLPAITEVCLRRFPALFELAGYAGWPDAATVADALRDAEHAALIKVSAEGTADLSSSGHSRAKEVKRSIGSDTVSIRLEDIGRGLTHRAAKAIDELTRSKAWELFKRSKSVSDGLACEALQCSLQSHPKAIRRAIDGYISAATELNRADVLKFLHVCQTSLGISGT
jgi:hypothetical protein